MCKNYFWDSSYYFKFAPAWPCMRRNFCLENLIYGKVLKVVAVVRKTGDEIRITIFLKWATWEKK
jgi:hypothetical protein